MIKETTKNLYQCEAEKEGKSDSDEFDIEETCDIQNPSSDSGDEETPKISITSIIGIHQPRTLKLKGHIKNNNVVVLFDTGSSHNFIDVSVAKRLNLFIYLVLNMKVMVADGKKIEKVGKCHKVKLQIQEYNLESEFYVVPLGGVDAILGIQWLQTLGTYSTNHQEHFIMFKFQGEIYKLYGFQTPRTQIVSPHKMEKLIRKGAPTYVVQCQEMELLTLEVLKPDHPEI